jgi:cation transport ATPase
MGIRCLMITGDGKAVAKSVAARLGLDDYFAEVLPHQKLEKVREVKRSGVTVAMIGDGVNDAPALVESDLGLRLVPGRKSRLNQSMSCWCAAIPVMFSQSWPFRAPLTER